MTQTLLGRLFLAVLATLCVLRLADPDPPTSSTLTLQGTRITCFERPAPAPRVFVVHSVFQDHFTCLPMARALWRAGLEAAVVEFESGRGFGEYVVELEQLVRASDRSEVYGVGHSMGADVIFSAAGFERRAALGFPVEASLLKGTVLVGAGAWDQVHTRSTLQEAAGDAPLIISPYSDHSQESLDPYLQKAVAKAFGRELRTSPPNKVLAQGGLVLTGAALLIWLLPPGPSRRRAIATNLIALALLCVHWFHPQPVFYTLAFTLWLGAAWAHSGRTAPKTVRLLFLNLFLISVVAGLSWALHGYRNILAEPACLIGLPVAVLSWFPVLTSRITNALAQPSGPSVLSALILTEIFLPGKLVSFGRRLSGRFYRRILTLKPRLELGAGRAQTVVLIALLVVGGLMWAKTLAAGYALNQEEFARLVWKLGSLILLPIVLWVLLVRRIEHEKFRSG